MSILLQIPERILRRSQIQPILFILYLMFISILLVKRIPDSLFMIISNSLFMRIPDFLFMIISNSLFTRIPDSLFMRISDSLFFMGLKSIFQNEFIFIFQVIFISIIQRKCVSIHLSQRIVVISLFRVVWVVDITIRPSIDNIFVGEFAIAILFMRLFHCWVRWKSLIFHLSLI